MPHVEIKYSNDITLDTELLFTQIETLINKHDPSAGVCKSRAYPCKQFKHSHVLLTISLLSKPHRDDIFTTKLADEIEFSIKQHFTQSLYFSFNIEYANNHYRTQHLQIDQP